MCCSLPQTASDFCVAPDSYVTKVTRENAVINQGMCSKVKLSLFVFHTVYAGFTGHLDACNKVQITKKPTTA